MIVRWCATAKMDRRYTHISLVLTLFCRYENENHPHTGFPAVPDHISLPSIAYVVPITIYERSCETTVIGSTDRLLPITKKLLLYAD